VRPPGRPRKDDAAVDDDATRLRERVAKLEAELQAATIRAELATTLPRVGGEAGKKR
jgi:hypothetical protein